MTTAVQTGALSRPAVDWNTINWQSAQCIVRRLKARIVKARQAVKPRLAKRRIRGLSWMKGTLKSGSCGAGSGRSNPAQSARQEQS